MANVSLDLLQTAVSPDDPELGAIARELEELVRGEVRFSPHDRMLYSTDASIYQVEPIGVVIPRDLQDVERIVRFAAERGLTLLPRGGGTSLAGQTVNRSLVIDFSPHCHRILALDSESRSCRVEPGVVLDKLNRVADGHGLMFGPDVATSTHATLGGMIGNNSAGAHSILYGRTVEHLTGIEVVLADGSRVRMTEGAEVRDAGGVDLVAGVAEIVRPLAREIRDRFPRTLRHVDGYNLDLLLNQLERSTAGTHDRVNLAHLVCGSEGTLAVTVAADLKLVEAPRCKGLAIVPFTTLDEALGTLDGIISTDPAAVELLDDMVISLARRNAEHRRHVELLPTPAGGDLGAVFYVEYFAGDEMELDDRFESMRRSIAPHSARLLRDPVQMANAWKLRKAGEPLLHALPGRRKPITFIEDTAVDPGKLPAFVAEFRRIVQSHGTSAAYYAHASVGCLHIRPLIDLRDPDDLTTMHAMIGEITDLVRQYEGALSGEHGDGRVRSHLLERFYGPAICDGFRRIKQLFDPENRLNPGNIVDPAGMTEHLRVRPHDEPVEVPPVKTFFRYEREHGFAEAVEQCNGAGVCRKTAGGTMCPSFRATRDERHSTRGRGNALRLAITGQIHRDGRPVWNDAETMRTLDLCLSCKACRTECPSNVDIAKLKAEYTAQKYAHGAVVPWRTHLIGHVRAVNRIGSAVHPLANLVARNRLLRSLPAALMGVAGPRSLPRFGPSLHRWFEHRPRSTRSGSRPTVILLPDCFTTYNEPAIGQSAVAVLEACGYRVHIPRLGCCGRSMISVGMLRQAQQTCRATAEALLCAIDATNALAVVVCEPSCLSAIKDDWLDLDMGIDPARLQRLAGHSFLVEEFVEDRWDSHPTRLRLDVPSEGPPVLLHGHCHQKALWGEETSSRLLVRLFGDRVQVIDSGCCGMAGSFGMTAERFDLSLAIGEETLFPAVRDAPEAMIAAPGTSCRHQLLDGVGRIAHHPIEFAHRLLNVVDVIG